MEEEYKIIDLNFYNYFLLHGENADASILAMYMSLMNECK